MWWPLLSDRKLPLLLILQWLSLRTVGAAYYPNFGLVGCYRYKDNMEQFNSSKFDNLNISYNDGFNKKTRFLHCIQGCLKNNTQFRYAGLMKSEGVYECFCGKNYNQTFAVDLNDCLECQKCMKIYNTDYDIKPLLSIPGNGPKLVEIWNSSENPFMNDVMRNPAIDWWNEKKLYHEPEYVKLLAMNRYGQNIWEMEFFTKNSTSANACEWLTKKNALDQSKGSICCSEDRLEIKNGEKYYFVQKKIEESGPIVTLATRNNDAQPIFQEVIADCAISVHVTEGYCCKSCITVKNCCKQGGSSQPMKYNTSFHMKSSEGILTIPINNTNTLTTLKDCCNQQDNQQSRCPIYDNNGAGRNSSLEEQQKQDFAGEGEYICGIVLHCCIPPRQQTCRIDIMRHEKIVTSINVIPRPYACSPFLLDTCVWASTIILKNCTCKCTPCISVYRQKDNVLAVVDRLVVLGFYHKEEPKVSKWEFLNDFPPEEVYNIMRPHLEKVRHEGAVPVRNLSSRARTKQSATDERTSSRGIGIMGGCLLGFVILIIFISDIFIIKVHLMALFRNLRSFCCR